MTPSDPTTISHAPVQIEWAGALQFDASRPGGPCESQIGHGYPVSRSEGDGRIDAPSEFAISFLPAARESPLAPAKRGEAHQP
jgi:hypothetical protein